MITHTPGPWVQYAPQTGDNESHDCFEVFELHYARIGFGRVCTVYGEPDTSEANARLIAAAPALAEALAAVYALRSGIINEANKNGTRFTPGTDRVDHFAEAFTKARAALAEAGVQS